MKFCYKNFINPIFEMSRFNCLVIEHPDIFKEFNKNMINSIEKNDEMFFLSNHIKLLDFSKNTEYIRDIWSLKLNERRLLTKLYNRLALSLQSRGDDEELLRKWNELLLVINNLLTDQNVLVPMEEETIINVLKIFNISFLEFDPNNLLLSLIEYVVSKVEYDEKSLFIFNQVLAYLNNDELNHLRRFSESEEVHFLFLEKYISNAQTSIFEKVYIYDNDLCEIIS